MPAQPPKTQRSLVAWGEIPDGHKGWSSRGYLPHYDRPGAIQSVTFRLGDSLPQSKQYLLNLDDKTQKRRGIEEALNRGYGECQLHDPQCAKIVEDAFKHFDGERYNLFAWVVMPNHVHVIFEPLEGFPLGEKIIDSWKGHTVSQINKLLGRKGSLWCVDFFDRFVRDEEHFWKAVRYTHNNPVKAGLCENAQDWKWSSAFENRMVIPERYLERDDPSSQSGPKRFTNPPNPPTK